MARAPFVKAVVALCSATNMTQRTNGARAGASRGPWLVVMCIGAGAVMGGCASPGAEETPSVPPSEATAGGETATEDPEATAEVEPEPVLVGTTPVPVPQPATPREELSREVQRLWTSVEDAVALRPPEPPDDSEMEAIEAWSAGPFVDWVKQRREHMAAANRHMSALGDHEPHERGMAAGLLGYMYEDMASAFRGAPVPEPIAADPELLAVYVQALHEALRPYARFSAQAYLVCAQTLVRLGEDSPWFPWAEYCDNRGAEVIDVFEVSVGEEEEEEEEPAEPPVPEP